MGCPFGTDHVLMLCSLPNGAGFQLMVGLRTPEESHPTLPQLTGQPPWHTPLRQAEQEELQECQHSRRSPTASRPPW